MNAVDSSSKYDLSRHYAHGLPFQIIGNALDEGRVVQESLLAHTNVRSEASLSLFLGAKAWEIASWSFGQTRDSSCRVEELSCRQRADKSRQIRRKYVHA